MSKNEVRIDNSCDGKLRFTTPHVAHAAKASLGYVGMAVYRCRYCCRWHIGHSRRRPKPRTWQQGAERNWRKNDWRVAQFGG